MRNPRWMVAVAVFALVAAASPASMAMKHIVNQSGLTFSPGALSIVEGDTVQWIWSTGGHTVTNGNGSSDPGAGTLFDAPLNLSNPAFEYVFTTAGTYPYFCRPHETLGMTGTITVDVATGARPPLAAAAWLGQNYPNPFNGSTRIEYVLPERASVTLTVYDLRGRLVARLEEGPRSDGPHSVVWNGKGKGGKPAPAGVYFYRLESGTSVLTRKLAVLR